MLKSYLYYSFCDARPIGEDASRSNLMVEISSRTRTDSFVCSNCEIMKCVLAGAVKKDIVYITWIAIA